MNLMCDGSDWYMANILDNYDQFDANLLNIPPPGPISSKCDHKWKFYRGLNESFEYCEHCDEKKSE